MPIITTDKPMRKRAKADHYPTAYGVCAAALRLIRTEGVSRILDPGAGTGVWGQAARVLWPSAWIIGVELRNVPPNTVYDEWQHRSYKGAQIGDPVDVVMGNPPYKSRLPEYFVEHSLDLLRDRRGTLIQLLPITFLAGQGRGGKLWKVAPPSYVYVMSRRPSFIHSGEKAGNTDATEYALFIWDLLNPTPEPIIRWFDWEASA